VRCELLSSTRELSLVNFFFFFSFFFFSFFGFVLFFNSFLSYFLISLSDSSMDAIAGG
jgi:hypothetical protein